MELRRPKSALKLISRVLVSIAGAALFLYGIIAALSPLPLGVPLMVAGFLMIAGAVPATRPLLKRLRRKWSWFDGLVRQISERMPDWFGALQKQTAPGQSNTGASTEASTEASTGTSTVTSTEACKDKKNQKLPEP